MVRQEESVRKLCREIEEMLAEMIIRTKRRAEDKISMKEI